MFTLLVVLLIIDSLLLGVVVLLQSGKGGGLAALGGGGSTESFFGGRHTVTILTKMSWWCGGIFLGLSLILAGISTRGSAPRSVLEQELGPPAPVVPSSGSPSLPLDLPPAEEQTQQPRDTGGGE